MSGHEAGKALDELVRRGLSLFRVTRKLRTQTVLKDDLDLGGKKLKPSIPLVESLFGSWKKYEEYIRKRYEHEFPDEAARHRWSGGNRADRAGDAGPDERTDEKEAEKETKTDTKTESKTETGKETGTETGTADRVAHERKGTMKRKKRKKKKESSDAKKGNFFGSYIRDTREAMGLTLDDVEKATKSFGFADKKGNEKYITAQNLSKIENGQSHPTFRIVIMISMALKIDMDTLKEMMIEDMVRTPEKEEKGRMNIEAALRVVMPLIENHRLDPNRGDRKNIEEARRQLRAAETLRKLAGP